MPRNSQGLYTLPAGNPVVPNTLIESVWANSTMDDIAAALTASLPRDGSAPMTGDLVLAAGGPQTSRSAVSRAYMDSFLAYATGMPVGAIVTFAALAVPAGYLLCNGQAVSRTTFATLFATIGTTYGAGDGSTTFNVPDLRDQFIRGKGDSRSLGSLQAGSFAAHTHAVQDPGHTHAASQAAHSHAITTGSHGHAVSDPGHTHSIPAYNPDYTFDSGGSASPPLAIGSGLNTGSKTTGITIATAGNLGGSADSQQPAVTVASSTTGETIGATGGTETVPANIALVYLIKAENDTSGAATVVAISSSDTNMIAIDETAPSNPELVIKSNVAFGIPKLDASGKILLSQLPTGTQQLLGYWDASGGQTPSESFPANDYVSGDTYIISVQGTLNVYNPVTLVSSPTVVAVGSLLQYIENSLTNPTGWYYVVQSSTVVASQVGLTPVGSISATNVQAGFTEVDGDLVALNATVGALGTEILTKVTKTSDTGSALIPAGTDAQRDASPADGAMRFSTTSNVWEGWDGTNWVAVGGGITQGQADARYLQLTGGTLSGNLTSVAAYVSSAQALATNALTRKDYVDSLAKGPAFSASAASQTVTAGSTVKVNFTTEEFDTNNCFDLAADRFTPTVPGYYQVNGTTTAATNTSGSTQVATIRKNGVDVVTSNVGQFTGFGASANVSALVQMNGTTDYLELFGRNASNANFGSCSFSASLVRAV